MRRETICLCAMLAALVLICFSTNAQAGGKENKLEELLKIIDGRKYTASVGNGRSEVLQVRGHVLFWGAVDARQNYEEVQHFEITGLVTTVPVRYRLWRKIEAVANVFIIREDGMKIIRRTRLNTGDVRDHICLWQNKDVPPTGS